MRAVLAMLLVAGCALAGGCGASSTPTPQNVSPVVDAQFTSGDEVVFTWAPVEDVDYYDFHLFNEVTSDIEQYYRSEVAPELVCDVAACSLVIKVELPESDAHAWRVRAARGDNISEWSRSIFAVVDPGGG